MITGSSRSTFRSSSDTLQEVTCAYDIKSELPKLHDEKKNKSASVPSFVNYIKDKESYVWPSTETGQPPRDCLRALDSAIRADYPIDFTVSAMIQVHALSKSPHHEVLLSSFHTYLDLNTEPKIGHRI